ncbi:unnamed protein product, partial [Aureobasidium mustum]
MFKQKKMPPLLSCRQCHLLSVRCDRGTPCSRCVNAGRECTYDKVLVNGKGMYLRDDGRTRHGKLVVPDDPAAAPRAAAVEASAPGGLAFRAPTSLAWFLWPFGLHAHQRVWHPFPWTPSAAESAPARWQDFMPKKSSEGVSLSLRQHPSSAAAAAEKHKGDADDGGREEKDDDDDDEEMGEEDEEDENNKHDG